MAQLVDIDQARLAYSVTIERPVHRMNWFQPLLICDIHQIMVGIQSIFNWGLYSFCLALNQLAALVAHHVLLKKIMSSGHLEAHPTEHWEIQAPLSSHCFIVCTTLCQGNN